MPNATPFDFLVETSPLLREMCLSSTAVSWPGERAHSEGGAT